MIFHFFRPSVECLAGCVNSGSVTGEDCEQTEAAAAAASVKQPTSLGQGSQGQRVAKAVTKLEEKKQKRVTRQEQVFDFFDEIWDNDASRPSEPRQRIKFREFENPRWQRPLS